MSKMRAVCLICSDLLESSVKSGAPPCGHVFHFNCLNDWLKASSTCPQCRSHVTKSNILNLYYQIDPFEGEKVEVLENKVSSLKAEIDVKDFLLLQSEQQKRKLDAKYLVADFKVSKLEGRARWHKYQLAELSSKLRCLTKLRGTIEMLRYKNRTLNRDLRQLNKFQLILYGSSKSAEAILDRYGIGQDVAKALATYCYALKENLIKAVKLKDEMKEKYDMDFAKAKQNISKLQAKVSLLEKQNSSLTSHLNLVNRVMNKASGELENVTETSRVQPYFLRSRRMLKKSNAKIPKRRSTRNASVVKVVSNRCKA